MPARSLPSRFFIRSQERRIPTARRSSSASAPEKLATVMAMRSKLLLKERHAQRALQDRLQRGMRIRDLLFLLTPPHVGMHHLADDGPGPDDGDLHDEIVEPLGIVARQRGHLRAALHLEHADGVGLLQRAVDLIIFRQLRQIDCLAVVLAESAPGNP